MSVQAVMIDIITEDQATIQAINAEIPLIGDGRLIADIREHQAPRLVEYNDFGGGVNTKHLTATFRCITEEDQAQISENIIQVVLDNLGKLGAGTSSVKLHLCFHDEPTPKRCEEQIIYEVII